MQSSRSGRGVRREPSDVSAATERRGQSGHGADANLDLHVVQPDGFELYLNGQSTAGETDGGSYGFIDDNSNANCVIDGQRHEDVVFMEGPPPGDYTVRVDAFSLCGQADAQWQVIATLADGTVAGTARWEATDADTRGNHAAGAGRTAFTFTIY